jgi:parallel beta-helix repeat protein
MKGWMMLVLLGFAAGLFFLVAGTAEGISFVVDDDNGTWADYGTIQEAIDDLPSGNAIMVYNGTYVENIEVNDTYYLYGNGTDDTIIDGNNTNDVIHFTGDGSTMSGFHLIEPGTDDKCIYIEGENVTIKNCIIGSISDPASLGVSINNGHNATIDNCVWFERTYGVIITYSRDVTIGGCNGTNSTYGVTMAWSNNITVLDSEFWNNSYGIHVYYVNRDVLIENNTVGGCGINIDILSSSNNCTVANNTVFHGADYGIHLTDVENITVVGNDCFENDNQEIYLEYADYNLIVNNSCHGGTGRGISLESSCDWNTIMYNEVFNCDDYGIELIDSENNTIHHNNVADNGGTTSQGYDGGANNMWEEAGEGNYWSEWNGTGDYELDGGGMKDRNPLDNPTTTSAPEKVPEFGLLYSATALLAAAIIIRRKRR